MLSYLAAIGENTPSAACWLFSHRKRPLRGMGRVGSFRPLDLRPIPVSPFEQFLVFAQPISGERNGTNFEGVGKQ